MDPLVRHQKEQLVARLSDHAREGLKQVFSSPPLREVFRGNQIEALDESDPASRLVAVYAMRASYDMVMLALTLQMYCEEQEYDTSPDAFPVALCLPSQIPEKKAASIASTCGELQSTAISVVTALLEDTETDELITISETLAEMIQTMAPAVELALDDLQ